MDGSLDGPNAQGGRTDRRRSGAIMAQPIRPSVYADLHNADAKGRVRLNSVGTIRDLARQRVQLRKGLVLALYSDDADDRGRPDDLEAPGVVEYSEEEQCWVAVIDWASIRHASDTPGQARGGVA
jgi:hypothetical protein